jgi:hypothetical protein
MKSSAILDDEAETKRQEQRRVLQPDFPGLHLLTMKQG